MAKARTICSGAGTSANADRKWGKHERAKVNGKRLTTDSSRGKASDLKGKFRRSR
jgi:hypothetical protein